MDVMDATCAAVRTLPLACIAAATEPSIVPAAPKLQHDPPVDDTAARDERRPPNHDERVVGFEAPVMSAGWGCAQVPWSLGGPVRAPLFFAPG